MLLTLAFHHKTLKWLLPFTFAASSLPSFLFYWLSLRILTAALPSNYFRKGDDLLYEIFQKQILFFIQNFTRIKVIIIFVFVIVNLNFSISFMYMEIMKKYSRLKKVQF